MGSKILLLVGIFIVIMVSVLIARKKESKDLSENSFVVSDTIEDKPISFGYKCTWFAIKTTDQEKVAQTLGLRKITRSNWKTGLENAYNNSVFITPPVDGWILAVGWGLPHADSKEALEKVTNLANILSKEFGEAQFFFKHRVTEYHCWLKSIKGKSERIYSYVGEQGENIAISGNTTKDEKKYNLVNTLSDEAKSDDYFDRDDLVYPDEDLVMEIAGAWSINPTLLEKNKNVTGMGLLGTLK